MIRLTNRLFGTHPVVVHAPGAPYAGFQRLAQSVCSAPPRQARCEGLTILTWNSGDRPKAMRRLGRSLARLGISRSCSAAALKKNIVVPTAACASGSPYILGADSCDARSTTGGRAERFRPFVRFSTRRRASWRVAAVRFHGHRARWRRSRAGGVARSVWIARTEFAVSSFALAAARCGETSEQAVIKRGGRGAGAAVLRCVQWFAKIAACSMSAGSGSLEVLRPLGDLVARKSASGTA
jgi:hypothetical protein